MSDAFVPRGSELTERVADFLRASEGVADVEVHVGERTPLGVSMENIYVDVAWTRNGEREKQALILRREGAANFTNGTRSGEFDVLRALEATPVATPAARWLDADGAIFGRPTILLERLDGTANPDALTESGPAGADPDRRRALAERLFDQLIELHLIDVGSLSLARAPLRTAPDTARAEIDSWWALAEANMLEPLPELIEVKHWLLSNLRPSGRQVLAHGDFRPENVLLRDTDVVAVLDWELARVSDPLLDLGWYLLPLFAHQHTIPGVWEPQHILDHYARRTGLSVSAADVLPWSVLGMFEAMAMLQCHQRAFIEGRLSQGFTWWYQQGMMHLLLTMIGV